MWRWLRPNGDNRWSFGYDPPVGTRRRFVCYFYFQGFSSIQIGLHVDLSQPNLEIHIPFGFLRVGWSRRVKYVSNTGGACVAMAKV